MKKSYLMPTILMFILAVMCFIFFDIMHLSIIKDDAMADGLLTSSLSRLSAALLFGWLLYLYGGKRLMIFTRELFAHLIWALPCLMVAIINFPFSALISGDSYIYRMDLMGLYILYIISIALLEEFVFRAGLLILILEKLRFKKFKFLWSTLISSLIFSLIHLTNLIEGADLMNTLLQCLYTFLIGAMLAVTLLKLKNIWVCVLIHAIFDFGGL